MSSAFPPYPEGLDDALIERAATAMVVRAGRLGGTEEGQTWFLLGNWLLDVVMHRRSEFDAIVGEPEEGCIVDEGARGGDVGEVR